MQELSLDLPVGYKLDHFRIDSVLGQGGFGITYKAWDEQLQQWVAIKEYLPGEFASRTANSLTVQPLTNSSEFYRYGLDRFLEEARTLAKFKHQNIVRVSRYLEANGTAYLVMDFEEGESLSEYLKRTAKPMPETALRQIFIPLLRGLGEVHRTGFLHRDIKPGNIYIRHNGEAVLLDFGAARQAVGEHSRSMTGIVSAGYAPSEQYSTEGKRQGPWSDLYAIGATMYRCISGSTPIDAPSRRDSVYDDEQDPLRSATEIGAGTYSTELLSTIDWCMTLNYKQRPQSVQEVLKALDAPHPNAKPSELPTVPVFKLEPATEAETQVVSGEPLSLDSDLENTPTQNLKLGNDELATERVQRESVPGSKEPVTQHRHVPTMDDQPETKTSSILLILVAILLLIILGIAIWFFFR